MIRLICDFAPSAPADGFALEEVLFDSARHGRADTLRIWVNRRVVVIGRSQSVSTEVDLKQATKLGIPVIRRLSGGGAVYHYPGNLNISLYLRNGRPLGRVQQTFTRLGEVIVRSLASLGIEAAVRENGLFVGNKKIAGAAQARRGSSLLYHTTLLVKADTISMETLLLAMRTDYHPLGIASQPRATTTLAEVLPGRPIVLADFAHTLTTRISILLQMQIRTGNPTAEEKKQAERLTIEKYRSDQWNLSR